MFRQLITPPTTTSADLVSLPPAVLTALLELAWNSRMHDTTSTPLPKLGSPDRRSELFGLDTTGVLAVVNQSFSPPLPAVQLGGAFANRILTLGRLVVNRTQVSGLHWHHLIYAYMIENTRIYEIFRRVVQEYLHGEKLGVPSPATQQWLRSTVELFYRDTPPFVITTVDSHIRSDLRASRRNAYQRMFGMDLNHGTDDNAPYAYLKAEAANNAFVNTFEELLREVWIGIVNEKNGTGPKATDNAKIEYLASTIHDMLITRRQSGNLSREEFAFVSMMSWFHLTVDSELPVIVDLKAEAASPEERLFKIAQRVGLPAHGLSKSYFDISEAISSLLITIETGVLSAAGAAPTFYDTTLFGGANRLPAIMNTIITHWTAITGRDVKAGKVAVR